jgi:uncharacterized protein HemX
MNLLFIMVVLLCGAVALGLVVVAGLLVQALRQESTETLLERWREGK